MDGREECNSNESGWTKYIDPSDNENYNSSIDDDDDDGDVRHHNHNHHHQNYAYKKSKDVDGDDDDDDSFASDASSGPGHYHDVEAENQQHRYHGSKSSLASSGMKFSKEVKDRNERNTPNYGTSKGKETVIKTNKSSKQRKGKK